MFKRLFAGILACIMLVFGFTGCGKEDSPTREDRDSSNYSESVVESVSSEKEESTVESAVESDSDTEEVSSEEEKPVINFADRSFYDGVVWADTSEGHSMIDTEGNIIKSFSPVYRIVTDFQNGYAIVDKSGVSYEGKRNGIFYSAAETLALTSDKAFVVNKKGETVLDLKSQDYKCIVNYDGLDTGSVIVIKSLDTFEESGDYYYLYDLNKKEEKQISPCKDGNTSLMVNYAGEGYYFISETSHLFERYVRPAWIGINRKAEMINYSTGDVISLTDNKTITDTLKSADLKMENFLVMVTKDKILLLPGDVKLIYEAKCFILDLKNKECKPASVNQKSISYFDQIGARTYNDNSAIYCMNNLAAFNGLDNLVYDANTDKFISFEPKCDYECEILDYDKSNFLVKTKNNNGTEYYTVIGWDMIPKFSPKKYFETTTLVDKFVVSASEDEENVVITDIESNKEIKTIEDASISYIDKTNLYVWVLTNDEHTKCYKLESGEEILDLEGKCEVLADISEGYVPIHMIYSRDSYYNIIDMKGNPLELHNIEKN